MERSFSSFIVTMLKQAIGNEYFQMVFWCVWIKTKRSGFVCLFFHQEIKACILNLVFCNGFLSFLVGGKTNTAFFSYFKIKAEA